MPAPMRLPAPQAAAAAPDAGAIRILVVDDNEDGAEMLAAALTGGATTRASRTTHLRRSRGGGIRTRRRLPRPRPAGDGWLRARRAPARAAAPRRPPPRLPSPDTGRNRIAAALATPASMAISSSRWISTRSTPRSSRCCRDARIEHLPPARPPDQLTAYTFEV